jgi:prepilin-type N-terminal cleavage/methylation domain-containing protein
VTAAKGYTLAELLAVLAVLALAVAVALPAAAEIRASGRTAAGARAMAVLFSAERWKSVARGHALGLQFRKVGSRWTYREASDGNGNGLRSAEIARGVDTITGEETSIDAVVPGVVFGLPPGGPYPEAPPGTDLLTDEDDPVRFGRSTIVSFGPSGTATSGTLYVTDGNAALCAVVLFGPTSRLRVWRWDRRGRRWTR